VTKTYSVQDGALPWYDRTNWVLDGVPESLKGQGPLPQQNCGSRALEVPGTPKSIAIGVSDRDVSRFKAKYPAALETGLSVAVKNPSGTRLAYHVLTLPNPPSQLGGGLLAGLLLLKMDGTVLSTPTGSALSNTLTSSTTGPATSTPASTTPAPVVTVPLPPKENFYIYILMGQSNMVGRDTRTLDAFKENPRVLALNPDGQWVLAKDPLHEQVGRIVVGVGPGTSFALEMLKANPKVTIGLVPCAVGGTPLRRWVKGGDLYETAVKRAKLAAKTGVIKGVLWHQGETDTLKQQDAETYETRLTKMLSDLRADLSVPDLPVVVGQLGDFLALTPEKNPYFETVRAAIKHVSEVVPHVGYADSAGLDHKGDKLHFTADAEREMGARFAKAMHELQK
jgi:hypothetical protein